MKYMVMECHPAYAVLMDEASRLVYAANLHYEVGQFVESPVLMQESAAESRRPHFSVTMRRCLAAAACLVLLSGAGIAYYRGNYMPYSTIVVSAAADVSMDVSRSGRVLAVHPLNDDAAQLLSDYDCRGKDQRTVANELLGLAVENGYVSAGDTVYVYLDTKRSADYDTYRTALEEEIAAFDLNADVHAYSDKAQITQPTETVPPTEQIAVTETTASSTEISAPETTASATVEDITEEPTEKSIPSWGDESSWDGWYSWRSWDPWDFHQHWYRDWDDTDDDDDADETEETHRSHTPHDRILSPTEASEKDDAWDDDEDDGEDSDSEDQQTTEDLNVHGHHGWFDDDDDDEEETQDTDSAIETPYIENPPIATHPHRGWTDDDDEDAPDLTEYDDDHGWWDWRDSPYPAYEEATESLCEDPTEPAAPEVTEAAGAEITEGS